MQLSCPEFRLRGLPRIPVRGQMVQGGRVLLRKAPLPSRVYPWSTRRHCGPLAFRCATEGSRSAKEGEGSQEGTGNHTWCPVPFCLRRQTAAFPPVNTGSPRPPKAANDHALRGRKVASSGEPLYRRKGSPSAEGYKVKRLPDGSLKSPPGGSAGTAAH